MLHKVFFNEKPVKTLACLAREDKFWYPSMISKEIDCTYPHMMNILNVFEQEGLITTEAQGRIKIVKLTQNGEDLAHDLDAVLRRIERIVSGEETGKAKRKKKKKAAREKEEIKEAKEAKERI